MKDVERRSEMPCAWTCSRTCSDLRNGDTLEPFRSEKVQQGWEYGHATGSKRSGGGPRVRRERTKREDVYDILLGVNAEVSPRLGSGAPDANGGNIPTVGRYSGLHASRRAS
jgi:hypothetical protein